LPKQKKSPIGNWREFTTLIASTSMRLMHRIDVLLPIAGPQKNACTTNNDNRVSFFSTSSTSRLLEDVAISVPRTKVDPLVRHAPYTRTAAKKPIKQFAQVTADRMFLKPHR
jgi:hypothetical protein